MFCPENQLFIRKIICMFMLMKKTQSDYHGKTFKASSLEDLQSREVLKAKNSYN